MIFLRFLESRSRSFKILALVLVDAVFLISAAFLAYMLRMSDIVFPARDVVPLILLGPLLTVATAALFGVYLHITRLSAHGWNKWIILSQIPVVVVWSATVLLIGREGFPRSVIAIFAILAPVCMIYARRLIALIMGGARISGGKSRGVPSVIVGADSRSAELFASLQRRGGHRMVAFVETDAGLVGGKLAGRKVVDLSDLPDLIEYEGVREVIVAKADFTRADHRKLVEFLHPYPVAIKVVPGLEELATGQVTINAARPVRVEDVLGRDPVRPRATLLTKAVAGKCVLVTGAGGSIGSEIVRQTFRYNPSKLILVDNSEFALFEIHREIEARLQGAGSTMELKPVLGSVADEDFMLDVMTRNGVDVVFHAAAYKHVRMVQENPVAGVVNNVFGTFAAARAAAQARVETFILVSTDKAVRPTSVMGATKRVAEMVLQGLAAGGQSETVFLSVRFGNVLGSSGSVVPLFRQQIERGGPITVTDPEVTRYFMLIPEAAQLVIQAAAMAHGGEVFVLDMGEPVKILDLARKMVEIAGLTVQDEDNPDGDIEIKFVGLNDGEKLYEELLIGENVSQTAHERIMQCNEHFLSADALAAELAKLRQLLELGDEEGLKRKVMRLAAPPAELTVPQLLRA